MPNSKLSSYMSRGVEPVEVQPYSTFEYGGVGNPGEVDLKTYAYTRTYLESCVEFISSEPRYIRVCVIPSLDEWFESDPEKKSTTYRTQYDLDYIRSKITENTVVFRLEARYLLVFGNPDCPEIREDSYFTFVPVNANIFQYMYNEMQLSEAKESFLNLVLDKGENTHVIKTIKDGI